MKRVVLEGQSLLDVAMETGGVECVFGLAERNGMRVTDMPRAGMVLETGGVMNETAVYFERNGVRVATGVDGCDGIWDETFDLTFLK